MARNGWNSRYGNKDDFARSGISNTDIWFGRKLHVQDNYSKAVLPLVILISILVFRAIPLIDWHFTAIRDILSYFTLR